MANILLVTNYFGFLHAVPLGNKTFYQSHNANNPDKQYSWVEMDEEEAKDYVEKNHGFDPKFKSPKQAVQQVAAKDEEIQRLKEELAKTAEKDTEIAKLRALLEEASKAPTVPSAAPAAVPAPEDPKIEAPKPNAPAAPAVKATNTNK